MATAFDSVLDRDLARRFVRLDWHLRRVRMIRGLGWLAVVLTFVLAGAFTFDLLVKPAAGLRVILLAGIGVAAAAVFVQTVVRPVLRKHTAAELAAVVEHAYPDLGERLTSAIELNDPSLPEEWKGSALMREMLTRQTMRSVAPLDFATAVSQSRATRASLCGMAALVLLISPAFVAPGGYRLLWSRLFNPWGNFDTPGNLSFEIEGGDRVVASGDDVTIRAHVRWRYSDAEPPRNVRLHWRDASGTTDSRQMERDADGTYATTLTNLFHPLEFHVAAGSDRSRTYQIHVVERPELLTAVLDVQPPAYTGLTAHKFDGVRGELAVFEGSRMKLHATFNKPVESADWRWLHRAAGAEAFGRPVAPAEGDPDAVDPAHMPLVLSSDRRSATLELTATEGGAFVFQLTDAHGLHNALEPDRVLVITPDAPPQIELGGSSQPRKARPDDVLRVDVRARDDVGLGALELHYEILRGGKDVFAVDPAHIRGRELDHAFELNLAGLELDSGSLLTYRIRAADNRPVPGPNETWSDPRVISIDPQAGPPESADVAERQQELRALLDEIRRDLDTNQAQVADLRKAAEDAGNDREFERNAEIPAVARAQRDLAGRVEDFAGRLAEHPLFANLTDDAEQVARETLDPAGQALEPAAAQPLAEKTESLQKNAGQLEQADDDLAEIAARFDDLARLEQELLELSRLARQAEQLAERALDLDRRRNERPPGETPAERAAREQQLERDREALAREHDSLMRQLDSLLERRPEILDAARQSELDRLAELSRQMRELIEPQDLLAEALRNEVRHAAGEIEPLAERQQELLRRAEELAERTDPRQTRMPVQPLDPELLRQALEALKAGNLAAAEERQQAAADELEQLAQELAKNERLPADPQAAAEELERRQRDLDERIAAAAQNVPAADAPEDDHEAFRDQLRALAREQAGIQAGAAALDVPRPAHDRQQDAVDRAADAVEQLLAGEPRPAARSSELAADALDQLAGEIGTPEERTARAREAVARLREQQQQLAGDAARAAAEQPPQDLSALAERQGDVARQVADLDAPGAAAEQHSAVRRQAAALTDLQQQRAADVSASQAQADQALERLQRRLAGEPVPPETPDSTASPAEQAEQLARRQQALADASEEAAEGGDVPSAADRRQTGERLAGIRRGAEELRAGEQARDARREALETLRKADEARRQVDEAARPEQPQAPDAPARDASDQLQRLMRNEAQAQQNAADALQRLAERLNGNESRNEVARRDEQDRDQLEQLARESPQAAAAMTPSDAGEPNAGEDPAAQQAAAEQAARQAADLANQQRELAQQSAAARQGRPNQENAAERPHEQSSNAAAQPDAAAEQPAAAQPTQSPADAQQQLAREAAELALDTARQTGPESEPTAQAAQFARQSTESARQAAQGRLADAADTASRAAQSARQAAEQLGNTPGEGSQPLQQRASDLAERQSQQADALDQAAQSADARRTAQQAGQQRLAQAAGELSQQLDNVARNLGDAPLDLGQPAEQARSSQQATEQAREEMEQASGEIGRGDTGQAAQSAHEAAERLRQAADQSAAAAQQQEPPPSDVPSDVAGRVTEAARRLAEARRHLAEAGNGGAESQPAQSGQGGTPAGDRSAQSPPQRSERPSEPSPADAQAGQTAPAEAAAQASSPGGADSAQQGQSQSGQAGQPGQPGQGGEAGQPGQSGESASPLSQTARSLQQAARALAEVAGQAGQAGQSGQPGQGGQSGSPSGGPPGQSQDGSGSQASGQPGAPGGASGSGSQAGGELDPALLDQELQRLSSRQWGQLPGHLRTEILQAARKKGNADYERLIKLYFEEIARTQPGTQPPRAQSSQENE